MSRIERESPGSSPSVLPLHHILRITTSCQQYYRIRQNGSSVVLTIPKIFFIFSMPVESF